jgi:hypothetical protein
MRNELNGRLEADFQPSFPLGRKIKYDNESQ